MLFRKNIKLLTMTKQTKKRLLLSVIIFLLLCIAAGGYFYFSANRTTDLSISKSDLLRLNDSAATPQNSRELDSLSNLESSSTDTNYCYRILITGVDARLNSSVVHADANHLLTVYPRAGYVDIISIPRGTLAPAGQSDSSGQNYLANTRAVKGRERYLQEVCRIAGVSKIDYYIEFGFSQALGLIKLLGFGKNSVETLRTLRARKSFPQGDYQRCYNQGQFIRQMILKHFPATKGIAGALLLKGALSLVETNLPIDTVKSIVAELSARAFPANASSCKVRLKPTYTQVVDFNFSNQKGIDSLHNLIVSRAPHDSTFLREQSLDEVSNRMKSKLESLINRAKQSKKNPDRIIDALDLPYQQKAWMQIEDENLRNLIRAQIVDLLKFAYSATGAQQEFNQISKEALDEEKAFKIKNSKTFYIWAPYAVLKITI
jgi:anionic cell wall polymer biosynthesis LytR-Cps2A-Psr (LCP) family protein